MRLIFDSLRELDEFRADFHHARFFHKRRNEADKYDYIKTPKGTGYRGIHDVYVYDVNSRIGTRLEGLFVEIQYRTLVQHAWATAVEVIGFITESQPNELIRFQLDFEKPMKGTNIAEFTFKPEGAQTAVTWTMSGKNGFVAKAFGLVVNCDKMVGGQFENGLASMKAIVEAAPKP